jgi:tetratricopeptide (TPR) repeat protein
MKLTGEMRSQSRRFQWSLRWTLVVAGVLLTAAGLAAGIWRWTHPLPTLGEVQRWLASGRFERADAAIGQLLKRRPKDGDVLMLAARVAAGRGDLERCVSLLGQIPPDSSLKPEAWMRQAQAEQEMSHGRRAEAAWRELIELAERDAKLAPYLLTARAELVAMLSLERRTDEARAVLWQMMPGHMEKWRVLIALARTNSRSSTPQSALETLEQLVESDPDDLDARRGLAMAAIDAFQWDRAIELATVCLEREPSDVRALEILLECHLRQQQWEAMDAILARPELNDGGPRTLRLRAQREEAAGRFDQAAASYRAALRLDPLDQTTRYQLAQLLQRRGDRDAAGELLAEFHRMKEHEDALAGIIGRFPQSDPAAWTAPDPSLCVEIAEHCAALQRTLEARAWLAEALRQEPKHPAALQALEQLK